jgi:hypothetical protein
VEIDLVGHEGGSSFGEFCFTLTITDVATGWTVNRSVANKAAIHVLEAIKHASALFPFPICRRSGNPPGVCSSYPSVGSG